MFWHAGYLMVYRIVPFCMMRNSLLGVVMLCEIERLPFRKNVSGVQILLTIRLLRRRISMGPSNFSRSSIHVCRKNTSIVYSWEIIILFYCFIKYSHVVSMTTVLNKHKSKLSTATHNTFFYEWTYQQNVIGYVYDSGWYTFTTRIGIFILFFPTNLGRDLSILSFGLSQCITWQARWLWTLVKNSVVCNRGKKAEPGPSLSGIVNQIKIPKLL